MQTTIRPGQPAAPLQPVGVDNQVEDNKNPFAQASAVEPLDQFENVDSAAAAVVAPPISSAPTVDIGAQAERAISGFKLEIEQKKKARATADVIVSCLSPFLSQKGPIEDQVWLVLMRIMGKVQGERRDSDIESSKLERLQAALKNEQEKLGVQQNERLNQALSELEKVENSQKNGYKTHFEEENNAIESLSSVMRNQHEAIMGIWR